MNEPWLQFPQAGKVESDSGDTLLDPLVANLAVDPVVLAKLRSAIQYRLNMPFGAYPSPDVSPMVRLVTNAVMHAGWPAPLLPAGYAVPSSGPNSIPQDGSANMPPMQDAANDRTQPQFTAADQEDADMGAAMRANAAAAAQNAPPQSVRRDLEPLPILSVPVANTNFDATPLPRMPTATSQRSVAANKANPAPFPIDPTDGMRVGPTLERLRARDPDFAAKERADAEKARIKQEIGQAIVQANMPKLVAVDPEQERAAAYNRLRAKNSLEMALLGPFAGPGLATRAFGGDENAVAAGNEFGAGLFGMGAMAAGLPQRGGYVPAPPAPSGLTFRAAIPNTGAPPERIASKTFENLYPEDVPRPANVIPNDRLGSISQKKLAYVVMEDGELIVGKNDGSQGHIDLARGRPVLAAGEVSVHAGKIKSLDNRSGHYRPTGPGAQQAAENAFRKNGFDVEGKYVEKDFK